jgi:acyl-CoA thioesterase-1
MTSPVRSLGLAIALTSLALLACRGAPPNLHSGGRTIVCFGDSITAGVGRGRGPSYPERLAIGLGVPVINAGVPGDTAEEGLVRIDDVLERDPWLVVIEFGGNDILRQVPLDRTETALNHIVERVLNDGAVPLLIGVHGPFGRTHAEMFQRVADRYDVPLLPDVLEKILGSPALKSDRIHPNADGYQVLADAVAARVRPWLKARRRVAS